MPFKIRRRAFRAAAALVALVAASGCETAEQSPLPNVLTPDTAAGAFRYADLLHVWITGDPSEAWAEVKQRKETWVGQELALFVPLNEHDQPPCDARFGCERMYPGEVEDGATAGVDLTWLPRTYHGRFRWSGSDVNVRDLPTDAGELGQVLGLSAWDGIDGVAQYDAARSALDLLTYPNASAELRKELISALEQRAEPAPGVVDLCGRAGIAIQLALDTTPAPSTITILFSNGLTELLSWSYVRAGIEEPLDTWLLVNSALVSEIGARPGQSGEPPACGASTRTSARLAAGERLLPDLALR